MATKTTKKSESIDVMELTVGSVEFCILGMTPFICNSMSNKARQELLMPKGRKSAAEKKGSLKHNPYQEFRDSPYLNHAADADTYIEHLATAFKQSIMGAGLDVPGATKTQLGRSLFVERERVSIYGEPKLFMAVTRSADMKKTPDIRTRAILPKWACRIKVKWVAPILNLKTVSSLLSVAGITQGMGDWRAQKGSGNYGQFEVVDETNKEFQKILKMGRDVQIQAMENPVCYDEETEKLLSWFDAESNRRGLSVVGGTAA